jgi:DNA-directed RNA polymerase specialized sigma24 family protein
MNIEDSGAPPGCFPTTEWTQIFDVIQQGDGPAASAALENFCEQYRPAIRNFFLRRGADFEHAEEYTQNFFLQRILKPWDGRASFLHTAERRAGGKFRNFLSHVLWLHLHDEQRKALAVNTGGQAEKISLSDPEHSAEELGGVSYEAFGRTLDRELALEIIRRAAARSCHSQYHEAHLRGEMSQAEAARELDIQEGTFKMAHHRFRRRLAEDIRAEVARLVGPDEGEVREEIAYLISLFAESGQ